jgi:hypothetical protein
VKRNYALWSLIALFVYYEVDRWTPLRMWNGNYVWPVRNDQFYLDVLVSAVLLVGIFSFRSSFRIGMVFCTAVLGLWTYFHLQSWWIPYIRGATSPRAIAFHAQFLDHTQILPRYGNHFPPDAEHTFIDVFVFPAFLLCLVTTAHNLMRKVRAAS